MKKFKTILMVLIAVLVSSTTMLKAQKPSSSSDLNSETSVNTGKSENYQLFTKTVKPGKLEIISEVKNASTEYWEFSNGVKVYLKPTQFKDDEIMLYAFRKGGYNIHKAEDLASAENSASLAYYSGVAKFDFSQMNEFLSGKKLKFSPFIDEYYEGFSGFSSIKDLETMLQLVNLSITEPRLDENAFNDFIAKSMVSYQSSQKDFNTLFNDSVQQVLYNHHPMKPIRNKEYYSSIDFMKAKKAYEMHFSTANDYNFVLVGSINKERDRKLIEKYIGSLPVSEKNYYFSPLYASYAGGKLSKVVNCPKEVGMSRVYISFQGNAALDINTGLHLKAIAEILKDRYSESIIGAKNDTYCVNVDSKIDNYPQPAYKFTISFDCVTANAEKLASTVAQEIENIIKNGPGTNDLQQSKANLMKDYAKKIKENDYWLKTIVGSIKNKESILSENEYKSLLNEIHEGSLQEVAKQYLSGENKIEMILKPSI